MKSKMDINKDLYESIAKLCYEHFKTLPTTGKPTLNQWTVMSCIVKEENTSLEVVALGTGSKCIGKNSMSPCGDIINDSHAEIICRRSFLRYLYCEIKSLFEKENSIFEREFSTDKCKLRSGIYFHLFTTHVPCGDATIFPKEDIEDFGNCISTQSSLNPPESLKRKCEDTDQLSSKKIKSELREDVKDIHRTGAKCLPSEIKKDLHSNGIEYHTLGAIRTKPGRGDPTLSVSCSDKIAKWTHLGIQGALLCLLIEKPVYLTSLTVAENTPFSKDALERALVTRFGNTVRLEDPFHCHPLIIHQCSQSFPFAKNSSKQPNPSSIIWCKSNYKSLEVAVDGRKQGATKKNLKSKNCWLQISKNQLFNQFYELAKMHDIHKSISSTSTYKQCKNLAASYQSNWLNLKQNLFKVWTVKDDNLLSFIPDPT